MLIYLLLDTGQMYMQPVSVGWFPVQYEPVLETGLALL